VALAAAAAGSLSGPAQAAGGSGAQRDSDDSTRVLGAKLGTGAVSATRLLHEQSADARQAAVEAKRHELRLETARQAREERAARAARTQRRQAVAAKKAAAEKAAAAKKAAAEKAAKSWVLPIHSYRLSAGFGASSSLWSHRHTGQDFAAPIGTKVFAAAAGTIVSAGYEGSYGNKIVVRHEDGTETWYCHLSRFEMTGGEVAAGQLIGRVGTTGNSTGPHLHFEVRPGGDGPVSPLPFLRRHGVG
jgi:murein DD-endopeptidase MepM/ murein hydrolase activator NlpD